MSSTAVEILGGRDVATAPESPLEGGLRLARYSVYPRAERNHGSQAGYTRSVLRGASFTLVTTAAEAVGELLRVSIQGLGEGDARDTLARVVSCRQVADDRFELRLQALEALAARKARRRSPS